MKNLKIIYTLLFSLMFVLSCEQERLIPTAPELVIPTDPCGENPTAGSADFTKFVAIGSSFTAGFQAGALFDAGQEASLGNILATQFECVGGGVFNQPSIRSEFGYNIFVTPNPDGASVLGRFLLQGTPPAPAPYAYPSLPNADAIAALPDPTTNTAFMYTGNKTDLNNFGVPAVQLGQAVSLTETGNWALADIDTAAGAQPHPYFNPFYARFASLPGTSTMLSDAIASLGNNGTFFLYWLGMDDVLLHAVYGADPAQAPMTDLPTFSFLYNKGVTDILNSDANLKGVIANYPDIFVMPHFTSVPWNAIPLTEDDATNLTTNLATNYNAFLDGMVLGGYITADEAAKRKIKYEEGQNAILLNDETLTDLTPYMAGPYAGLLPYAKARQTNSNDIIPLGAGAVLGEEIDTDVILGVSYPVDDEYVLIPSEVEAINTRLNEFNTFIKSVAEGTNSSRLAFADVNTALKNLVAAGASVENGVTITPGIAPPTGIYSEEGLHPNSRGYAFIANVFIDAINTKFGATIPKANLANYQATPLPINP